MLRKISGFCCFVLILALLSSGCDGVKQTEVSPETPVAVTPSSAPRAAEPTAQAGAIPHPIFKEILPKLEAQTQIAVVLPTELPGSEGPLYVILEAVKSSGYQVQLAYTPDCQGQSACTLGDISGEALTAKTLPPEGDPVSLANGVTGYLLDKAKLNLCGAGYCFTILAWDLEGSRYTLQLKADQPTLIQIANSAIQWRASRQAANPVQGADTQTAAQDHLQGPRPFTQADLQNLQSAFPDQRLIANQVFRVNFQGFGSCTFVPLVKSAENRPKLSLNLAKLEQIIYTFPASDAAETWAFFELTAVAFRDVNQDGFEDVITIAQYLTGAGPTGAEPFPVATVYFNDQGKAFQLDESLNRQLEQAHTKTIGEVLRALKRKFP